MRASVGLPYPPYFRRVIRRSGVIWLLARCAYVFVTMGAVAFGIVPAAEGLAAAVDPSWSTRAFLVGLTTFLVWLDRKRLHELLFHANLGTRPGWFLGASLLTAFLLDIVVQAILEVL